MRDKANKKKLTYTQQKVILEGMREEINGRWVDKGIF